MRDFKCPQCGATLAPPVGELVSCASCGAETEVARLGRPVAQRPAAIVEAPAEPPRDLSRPRVAAPPWLELSEEAGLLRFRWRLGSPAMAMVPVSLAVFGSMWMIRMRALSALLILPVAWLYIAAAYAFDRLTVEVRRTGVRIRIGPVPWFGGGRYETLQLSQLYVKEHVYENKGNTSVTYSLNARLTTGKHVQLLRSLESQELARYLEQEIERKLEIEDSPVVDELPRD